MNSNQLIIFDTTLRDGEQSPGAAMTKEEKVRIARQLEKLGVNVIEAGFAAASPGDFEAVRAVAEVIKNSTVCSLARANENDIRRAGGRGPFSRFPGCGGKAACGTQGPDHRDVLYRRHSLREGRPLHGIAGFPTCAATGRRHPEVLRGMRRRPLSRRMLRLRPARGRGPGPA